MHGTWSTSDARTLLLVCNFACNCVVPRQKVLFIFSRSMSNSISSTTAAGVAILVPLQSAAHGYAHFSGSLLCDMRTVPVLQEI